MSLLLADRVEETTTTTGSGTISLGGAVATYQGFVAAIGSALKTAYVLLSGDGVNWECGIGTVTSGSPNTLSRDIITASSNSGSAISLSGTSTVWCDATAAALAQEFDVVTTSESISAGAMVNLWDNSGACNARNANATDNTKPTDGFAPLAISSAAAGIVMFAGINKAVSGLTPGTRYYLAAGSGTITATAPSSFGNLQQSVGVALTATRLMFRPGPGVTL